MMNKITIEDRWDDCMKLNQKYYNDFNPETSQGEKIWWDVIKHCGMNPEYNNVWIEVVFKDINGKLYSQCIESDIICDVKCRDKIPLQETNENIEKYAKAIHSSHLDIFNQILSKIGTNKKLHGYKDTLNLVAVESFPGGLYEDKTNPMYVKPQRCFLCGHYNRIKKDYCELRKKSISSCDLCNDFFYLQEN